MPGYMMMIFVVLFMLVCTSLTSAFTLPNDLRPVISLVPTSSFGGDLLKRDERMQLSMSTVIEKPKTDKAFEVKKNIDRKAESEAETGGKYTVLLFNDPMNYREYVARCLVEVVGMPEDQAFAIMGEAHRNGMGVVGSWHEELAEAYKEALLARSLTVDIVEM
mmetsp:Transcript_3066/g.5642  ORF Transcript_3066/g.5642 Transcript_3066/m.5642 type:complete len:163 (-) Transcript_3066:393-881(-)